MLIPRAVAICLALQTVVPLLLARAGETVDDQSWWSLRPLGSVTVPAFDSPWVRTPIDAFVLARLQSQNLAPSPAADRRTLIRRLTFDLHGLPPTPEAVADFVADSRDDAYDALVDRLLASPRYGERWGRHWLDIVHFGESHGYDKDKPRTNAWPYRDYVIASFNQDKPYDRFVAEQIAGDAISPDDPQATVATGFLVAGPWDFVGHVELREGTVDKEIARSNDRDDMVANTMSTFASLTVHCARCHDHKFDPISQRDYYALQAVFAGIERADQPYELDPAVERTRSELLAEKARIESRQAELKNGKGEGQEDEAARLGRELQQVDERIKALPPARLVFAATSREPRPIYLLARGDVRSPRDLVAPGGVPCVAGPQASLAIDDPDREARRRVALGRWLSDPSNALVRRSIVNRVWQYHFGRAIVDTPNDFGRMGSLPTHPELLEWLACWFIHNGHSLKKLHRLILMSAVYRQASDHRDDFAGVDADNRFLWRMNRQRLDAESIRDSMLAVSGKLDLTLGGPSVRQFQFKDDHSPIYDYAQFPVDDPANFRRGVYRFLVRSVPDPFMECLDCADPSIMTPKRNTTLTSIQALVLLNNPFVTRQAEHFAARLRAARSDTQSQIELAFQLGFARSPSPSEGKVFVNYIGTHGFENACRVILNSNEFIFVD